MTLDPKRLEAAAKETCGHWYAQLGEPPCFREDIGGEGALKSCPDTPICLQSTAAIITAYLEAGDAEPIPMLLDCPACHIIHLDEGEWSERPHKTHQCQSCGHEWRPAHVPTVGVSVLPQPPKKGEG